MDRRNYLDILGGQIRAKRARPMVVREIESHIEDQKAAFMAEGMTEQEAETAAIDEMGDPVEAGVALDRVHRPKMEWSVLSGVLMMSFLGLALQVLVIVTAKPEFSAGVLFSTAYDGVGKHVFAVLAGIVLMLAVCWLDYSLLNKYAVLLWALMNAILILHMLAGVMVNGRPRYIIQISWLFVPFYAGILYHFRGQGRKGLVKGVVCLLIPLGLLTFNYMLSGASVIGTVGLLLLHIAVHKGWFGNKKKPLYLLLWGAVGILALGAACGHIISAGQPFLREYQVERVNALLHPEEYGDYDVVRLMTAKAGEEVRDGAALLAGNMISEVRNSYLWIYLFKYLGAGKGILLTSFVIGFFAVLLRAVHRQKNQLGYMVGLGCVLFLIFQTALYIAMNFMVIPMGSAYMPFLSNGGTYLLITYFYMGILLSVCRNSRLVKN